MKRLVSLLFLFCCAGVAQSAPIVGVVVQGVEYDAQKGSTVRVLNASHKEITAFDITFQTRDADGRLSPPGTSFITVELVDAYIQNGKAFSPGALYAAEIPQPTPVEGVLVDMVAYADGTVEATNNDAWKWLMASRARYVKAKQEVSHTITENAAQGKDVLIAKLEALLNDESLSRGEIQTELDNVRRGDAAAWQAIVDRNDREAPLLAPHAQLTKAVQP